MKIQIAEGMKLNNDARDLIQTSKFLAALCVPFRKIIFQILHGMCRSVPYNNGNPEHALAKRHILVSRGQTAFFPFAFGWVCNHNVP